MSTFSPQFGGLWRLKAFQAAELVRDYIVAFRVRYGNSSAYPGMGEWMERMAEGARTNMERSLHMASGSGGVEERYIATARAELEELLTGLREYMRRERLPLWDKEDPLTKEIRVLAYHQQRTLALYRPYLETADMVSNCALSLIHQANFMLDQQIRSLQRRTYNRYARRPGQKYF